ncbi:MAG: hypothetical protein E6J78_05475 [Deltaproteobacteria bacterium]|nr:MAG: hypothetical protein E6J78_05475 [Deltaproteobacteria bacterium]
MNLRNVLVASAAVSLACGGGVNASVNGTIKGQSLKPADTVSAPVTVALTGGGTASLAGVVVSDVPGLCAKAASNTTPKSAHILFLGAGDVNPTSFQITAASTAGTYSIYGGSGAPPAKVADVSFFSYDASCTEITTQSASATSGTVTLTSVNNGSYSGNFDVTFDSGDHVTGSFSASNCANLNMYFGTTTHSCG